MDGGRSWVGCLVAAEREWRYLPGYPHVSARLLGVCTSPSSGARHVMYSGKIRRYRRVLRENRDVRVRHSRRLPRGTWHQRRFLLIFSYLTRYCILSFSDLPTTSYDKCCDGNLTALSGHVQENPLVCKETPLFIRLRTASHTSCRTCIYPALQSRRKTLSDNA